MIAKEEFQKLLERAPGDRRTVLSVYLDVDQGRASNLNRGYEIALKNILRGVEEGLEGEEELESFKANVERVHEYMGGYTAEGKTLVLFSDAQHDFWRDYSLRVPTENEAWLGRSPYLRPLIEARDEYERYGVILTDRAQARLFLVYLGEIEEQAELLAEFDVTRFDASGKDQMWSQMHFQRKAEQHAREHLKNVAALMEDLVSRSRVDRLLLAGTNDALVEVEKHLAEKLKNRVIGKLSIAVESPEKSVLEETMKLASQFEREEENALVETIVTASAKNGQGATGLKDTLHAAMEGRIHRLAYTADFEAKGKECTSCGALFYKAPNSCPHCGDRVREIEDILERLVEKVARDGGAIEHVKEEAADRLNSEANSIGAVLRF
jgi:rubrerythrin